MKTVLGTTGLIAAALFLSAAPNATAAGIPLEPIGTQVGIDAGSVSPANPGPNSCWSLGLGSVSISPGCSTGSSVGLGSVQVSPGSS
ncbi:hypothetical protein [Nocardia jejuensis]|uniref:hypothetical protein n=1 Tax=Nocardia jejuensis TaxID=328049 RepID=UPI00082A8419|nr:hypothetical protein [Nocardia jejuensis]